MSSPAKPTFLSNPKAALERYLELGYHIEPNVWTPEECDDAIAMSKTFPSALDGSFHIVQNPHWSPEFRWMICNQRIVAMMETVLGGLVNALQSQYFFGPPGYEGYAPHQDNNYVRSLPAAFGTSWSALTNINAEIGGLFGYPSSHREDLLPIEGTAQEPVTNDSDQEVTIDRHVIRQSLILPADRYEKVDISVPRGGVVLMHGHFVHGSHPNRSTHGFRHSFVVTYLRQGAPFRRGRDNKRREMDCYNA